MYCMCKLIMNKYCLNQITLTSGFKNYEQVKEQKYKSEAVNILQNAFTVISKDVNEIQNLRTRKEYCKIKLIEREGKTEWKTGKYSYAISAVIAFIYEIDQ